ncbi:cytochrome c [Hyphomicrobium sp.]|uniref:c-type cytochrome n=1 Tax=Hyphomicrobium sp. TaxID=82 RepID=UPI0025BEF5B6|nr:cytochrome c [Hyphomicrobium sp.]MCC7254130.1 cytochrome c [Hyphomicrobium sp.]
MALLATVAFGILSDLARAGGIPRSEQSEAEAPPTKIAGTPPFDLSDPKKIKSGESTFNSTCAAYCHGQNPTLFVDRTGLTEEYVYNTIRDGGKGATPMPPWGDVFSHEEIWELVAYLKSLGKW